MLRLLKETRLRVKNYRNKDRGLKEAIRQEACESSISLLNIFLIPELLPALEKGHSAMMTSLIILTREDFKILCR